MVVVVAGTTRRPTTQVVTLEEAVEARSVVSVALTYVYIIKLLNLSIPLFMPPSPGLLTFHTCLLYTPPTTHYSVLTTSLTRLTHIPHMFTLHSPDLPLLSVYYF